MVQKIKNNKFYVLIIISISILVVSSIASAFFDSDVFHILKEGREVLEKQNFFYDHSFVGGTISIIKQQWLWDVCAYSAWAMFGKVGLFGLTIISTSIFAIVAYYYSQVMRVDKKIAVLSITAILIFVSPWLTIRPTIITLILLLIQLIAIEKYLQTNKWQYLLSFIPLSILHINLHGSLWISLIIFTIPFIVPIFSKTSKNEQIRIQGNKIKQCATIALFLIPAIFASMLNPYGIKGITFLFTSMSGGISRLGIQELMSPTLFRIDSIVSILFIIFAICVCLKTKVDIRISKVFLFLGCLLMFSIYIRNGSFMFLSMLVLLFELFRNEKDKEKVQKIHHTLNTAFKKEVFVIGGIMLILIISLFNIGKFKNIISPVQDSVIYPTKATRYIEKYGSKKDKIFTGFVPGAFVSYQGFSRYMDARPELGLKQINTKEDYLNEYIVLKSGCRKTDYEKFKKKYNFKWWIVTPLDGHLFYYVVDDKGLKTVYKTKEYTLLEKK